MRTIAKRTLDLTVVVEPVDTLEDVAQREHLKSIGINYRAVAGGRVSYGATPREAMKGLAPTERPVTRADAAQVMVYVDAYNGVVCGCCVRDYGTRHIADETAGMGCLPPRPATSDDITRLPCCVTCGRDLLAAA